jgi:hypothetical protein
LIVSEKERDRDRNENAIDRNEAGPQKDAKQENADSLYHFAIIPDAR